MKRIAVAIFAISAIGICSPSFANEAEGLKPVATGDFVKKRYAIHGDWTISTDKGETRIEFGEAFKTKGGPDLKVFLSPRSLDDIDSQSALTDATYVGVLKSNRGEQTYILPSDIDLAQYESVIIQCEAFSVLWGGFDLPTAP